MNPDDHNHNGTSKIDRRAAKRHPMTNFVWYHLLDEMGESAVQPVEGICKLIDISKTGVGLVNSQNLAKGKQLFMSIHTTKWRICVIAHVTYCTPLGRLFRLGAQFAVVPPDHRILLHSLKGDDEKKPAK
jgi:hypothetical protein